MALVVGIQPPLVEREVQVHYSHWKAMYRDRLLFLLLVVVAGRNHIGV